MFANEWLAVFEWEDVAAFSHFFNKADKKVDVYVIE